MRTTTCQKRETLETFSMKDAMKWPLIIWNKTNKSSFSSIPEDKLSSIASTSLKEQKLLRKKITSDRWATSLLLTLVWETRNSNKLLLTAADFIMPAWFEPTEMPYKKCLPKVKSKFFLPLPLSLGVSISPPMPSSSKELTFTIPIYPKAKISAYWTFSRCLVEQEDHNTTTRVRQHWCQIIAK